MAAYVEGGDSSHSAFHFCSDLKLTIQLVWHLWHNPGAAGALHLESHGAGVLIKTDMLPVVVDVEVLGAEGNGRQSAALGSGSCKAAGEHNGHKSGWLQWSLLTLISAAAGS